MVWSQRALGTRTIIATEFELGRGVGSTASQLQEKVLGEGDIGTYLAISKGNGPAGRHLVVWTQVGDLSAAILDDADQDLDLALGDRLHVNDGTGQFQDVTGTQYPLIASSPVSAVAAADVDGDSDPDLVTVGGPLATLSVWLLLNDGAGFFSDASGLLPGGLRPTTLALADLDGDRDPDLVVGGENRVFANALRQLVTPFVPFLGTTYHIDAYARPPGQVTPSIVLPFWALGTAATPLPGLGVFGLAPPIVPLPPLLVPAATGAGLSIPVPNALALVGTNVHSQALVISVPGLADLTNTTTDVVAR
ncbi:MAG: VCBS repeat-containing protein [Planctomycetota bacterium]